jgi:hypothetical protein
MRKIMSCLIMSCGLYLIAQSQIAQAEDWYNPSWAYRRLVTIDHTKVSNVTTPSTTYANFPVLVYATGLSNINANGSDIRFTLSDGVTELPREIESYSSGTLYAWVKFTLTKDSGDSTNDTIYMYYGNTAATEPAAGSTYGSQNVWDSNYKLVHHMKDTTSSTITDSTANSNNGTKEDVNEPLETTGQIWKGQAYSTSTAYYINCGTNTSLNITGAFTIEILFKDITGSSGWQTMFGKGESGSNKNHNYLLGLNTSDEIDLSFGDGVNYRTFTTTSTISDNNWHHIGGVFISSSDMCVYKDGSLQTGTYAGTATLPASNTKKCVIGAANVIATFYQIDGGSLDEVRLSNTDRPAGWIITGYNNQYNQSTFCTFSGEERCTAGNFFLLFE